MLHPDSVRERLLPVLRTMLQHQGQRRLRYRLPTKAVYQILDEAKAAGLEPLTMRGHWTVGSVPLGRACMAATSRLACPAEPTAPAGMMARRWAIYGCAQPRHCRVNGSHITGPLVQPP